MANCELCGKHQLRRKRLENGKLVCWICYYRLAWSKEDIVIKTRKQDFEIDDLRSMIPPKKPRIEYKYNSPFSAIPPLDVIKNATIALDIAGYYSDFSQVLADYYGIDAPPYYVNDEKVPDGAIACYYHNENKVYSRKKDPMSWDTAFHEFYHALQNYGLVPSKNSEETADQYAKACVRRMNQ